MNRRKGLAMIAAAPAAVAAALFAKPSLGAKNSQSIYLEGEGMPYAAFDALPKTAMPVQGGTVNVAFAPGEIALPKENITEWIGAAAQSVTTYYGRFPVRSVRLLIVPVDGAGVRGGTTWGYRGAAIRMLLGRDSSAEDLTRDWKMTHEMVHLALPDMDRRYNWLSEGLAVYIEPIARVQAGFLTAESIWADVVRDMPKGLPDAGDAGLDSNGSWASTYWGGARFCLLADVEIRRQTGSRLGLQDAMRGVLAAGGSHEVDWPIRKILAVADQAVGLHVLTAQYDRMGSKAVRTDLTALWRDLGIEAADDGVRFHAEAPLAAERSAITKKPPSG